MTQPAAAALAIAVFLIVAIAVPIARGADEKQVRRDCRADALKHCKAAMLTLRRETIIACMIENRSKLSATCARHLW